jgi:hypothetical protein
MGWQIRALVEATPEIALTTLPADYALGSISGYEWYRLTWWLQLLKDITTQTPLDMFLLGMRAAERLSLPPWIDSISAALLEVEDLYRRAHRGSEIGEVFGRVVHGRHIRFSVRTPYPDDFISGLLWGIAQRYAPPDSHPELICNGVDRPTTFDVRW